MKEKVSEKIKSVQQFVKTYNKQSRLVFAALVIIITILVLAKCCAKEDFSKIAGNTYNDGIAASKGKWIYHIEVDNNHSVGINKTKANGKKTVKVSEGYYKYINVVGNYIYCLEIDENNSQKDLIRMKTNGKKKEILARDIDENQITVTDKWIYYHKNDSLYRAKLDGTDREKVSNQNITYYQISGNKIYYIYKKDSSAYIAKMNLNGEKSERIAKADATEEYEALYVKGGKVYYIVSKANENYEYEHYLYKMNKKGGGVSKICMIDTNIKDIIMTEDRIYYTITEDYETYQIKAIKYNGTKKETIKKSKYIAGINVVDNWIIYLGINEDSEGQMNMIKLNGKEEKCL